MKILVVKMQTKASPRLVAAEFEAVFTADNKALQCVRIFNKLALYSFKRNTLILKNGQCS